MRWLVTEGAPDYTPRGLFRSASAARAWARHLARRHGVAHPLVWWLP